MNDCPDCDRRDVPVVTRRQFVQAVSASAAAIAVGPRAAVAAPEPAARSESLVKTLYDSLTPAQKEEICFDWDYVDDRGLLRMHVSNNWQITGIKLNSGFFTTDQQELIEAIYWGLYNPDWKDRIKKQLQDDAGGYGKEQSIALFGQPGSGKFEFVMTGRHLTIRCDGDSVEHVAFGGPIFYGHAAQGFNEPADHPGNVYWHQALKANSLYTMLDGKQRERALLPKMPPEKDVHFRGASADLPGLPIRELSADQKQFAQDILSTLIEPYRTTDRDEVLRCLHTQGGLDACHIAFYQEGDIGDDKVWDVWRIEGPSFVWHYRGSPHVHVWVNVADRPDVKITTRG
uniref:DUF3500 domain-containing protein n=1 Tax=Schlesneria paludicola TaxID=360056 RepID=A0A7C4LLX4_9PLAN